MLLGDILNTDISKHYQVIIMDRIIELQVSQDTKKTRRKLPPIPTNDESVTVGKHKPQQSNSRKAHMRAENRRKRVGYGGTPSSTSDESMNEDDFEVAMWTKQRHTTNLNNLDKPSSLDKRNGNYIKADGVEGRQEKVSDRTKSKDYVAVNIPPDKGELLRMASIERNDQLIKDNDENDQIIDSLINIYGAPITQAMKSLKRKLQDELRMATEGRRRRIEEIEEIRALQLQIGELKLSTDYAKAQLKRTMQHRPSKNGGQNGKNVAQNGKNVGQNGKNVGQNGKKRGSQQLPASRSSPQVLPRRSRHKRQTSDPMISKFSPIKEDKDVESDFQSRGKTPNQLETPPMKYVTDDSSPSGVSDNESIRSEPVPSMRQKKNKPSAYAKIFYLGNKDESKPQTTLENTLIPGMKSKFHSESYLIDKSKSKSQSLDDEIKTKEDRKQQLQNEIEKRKKQLEETSRLQTELLNLTRGTQSFAHSYDDIPRTSNYVYPPTRPIPTGIIKPLEDEYDLSDEDSNNNYEESENAEAQQQSNYSSTEYLAHKQEARRTPLRGEEMHTAYSSPYLFSLTSDDNKTYLATDPSRMEYYHKQDISCDTVISSSVTLPELHSKTEIKYPQGKDTFSDTETSPPSDSTPAMPLLDDVKARSRKIIHQIGTRSRPASVEYNLGVDGKWVALI